MTTDVEAKTKQNEKLTGLKNKNKKVKDLAA